MNIYEKALADKESIKQLKANSAFSTYYIGLVNKVVAQEEARLFDTPEDKPELLHCRHIALKAMKRIRALLDTEETLVLTTLKEARRENDEV